MAWAWQWHQMYVARQQVYETWHPADTFFAWESRAPFSQQRTQVWFFFRLADLCVYGNVQLSLFHQKFQVSRTKLFAVEEM
jgi:hypothetical protein